MLDDATFDALLPLELRRLSRVHWTPAEAARCTAEWLVTGPGTRILDVGAGPGKLCCLGALHRGGHWHGIERDPACVDAANAVAAALAIEHATTFQLGDIADVDWRAFDAIYLYNPFVDALFQDAQHAVVAATRARLATLPATTRVVTFHGYGADLPPAFRLAGERIIAGTPLRLWLR
jgi:predicted RNA methylase